MKRADDILRAFATPETIVKRAFKTKYREGAVLYKPDLTDSLLTGQIVRALEKCEDKKPTADALLESVVYIAESEVIYDAAEVQKSILGGDAVVIVDGTDGYLICSVKKWDKRAIAEPPTSTVMRGPREGFIEDVKTNLSLIERRLKSPSLAVEKMTIGRLSQTTVALVYLADVAAPEVVNAVRDKLEKIDIDALTDSHYIQPYLEERPFSIFHQTGVTEKPDIVTAKLLEGRVAIVVDGSPMVVTVPFMVIEDYQSSEDYYERPSLSTFLRILRLVSIFFAVLLPGFYVALQEYHYSMIPLRFLITVMTAVNGIPLPPLLEIMFVILLFEVIREASVRMPRAVGMAMSIVGALVLGETAVKAGIISSPAVMITALSSIALYVAPNQEGTLTLLRVAFTALGGLGGMYFMLVGMLYLVLYLCSMGGFGTPYLAPLAPFVPGDLKDSFYRASLLRMNERPKSIKNINPHRQKEEK
ncbi:MAG TPA: spore germination protein [Clostridiales bacterium]|nr:spore germination protein [Clostridiales bacterium]